MIHAGITPELYDNNIYKSASGQSIRYSLKTMNEFRKNQVVYDVEELDFF